MLNGVFTPNELSSFGSHKGRADAKVLGQSVFNKEVLAIVDCQPVLHDLDMAGNGLTVVAGI